MRGPLKSGAWGGRPTCHPQTPPLHVTIRKTLHYFSYLSAHEDGTECSETSAYRIQTPGNYPEESVQHFAKLAVFDKGILRSCNYDCRPHQLQYWTEVGGHLHTSFVLTVSGRTLSTLCSPRHVTDIVVETKINNNLTRQ